MTKQDDFISTISHELRTPLTSIRGFAQTMLSSYDKLDDDSKKKFLQIIEQQSNRLIHLVENILSVTKLDDEHLVLKKVDVNNTISSVVMLLKQKYSKHIFNLNLNKNISSITADVDKLQQIFLNVIENACKYSDEGSTVIVDSYEKNNQVVIKVSDEGVGIDEKYVDTIFEKFSRIDNPLTRKVQGSGLGLYITKSLVEKMDGKIYFKNSDKGTDFYISFPIYNIEEHVKCCAIS